MEFFKVAAFLLFCLAVWVGAPQTDGTKTGKTVDNSKIKENLSIDFQTKE